MTLKYHCNGNDCQEIRVKQEIFERRHTLVGSTAESCVDMHTSRSSAVEITHTSVVFQHTLLFGHVLSAMFVHLSE